MTDVGDKKFGVVLYVLVGGLASGWKFLYFSTPKTAFRTFCETDF
jgi:hypothetical protein